MSSHNLNPIHHGAVVDPWGRLVLFDLSDDTRADYNINIFHTYNAIAHLCNRGIVELEFYDVRNTSDPMNPWSNEEFAKEVQGASESRSSPCRVGIPSPDRSLYIRKIKFVRVSSGVNILDAVTVAKEAFQVSSPSKRMKHGGSTKDTIRNIFVSCGIIPIKSDDRKTLDWIHPPDGTFEFDAEKYCEDIRRRIRDLDRKRKASESAACVAAEPPQEVPAAGVAAEPPRKVPNMHPRVVQAVANIVTEDESEAAAALVGMPCVEEQSARVYEAVATIVDEKDFCLSSLLLGLHALPLAGSSAK